MAFDAKNWLALRQQNEARLSAAGIYHPSQEHDACGVGLVAAVDGKTKKQCVERFKWVKAQLLARKQKEGVK